jgi:hypothetical protein
MASLGQHRHHHAFGFLHAEQREGLILSRRNLLKASLVGVGALSWPRLLQAQAERRTRQPRALILLWLAGGPSHIDMLDPKPHRPPENRGPFGVIRTRLPGVVICEHLPRLAERLDRFTLLRSVDCRGSNHEPNTVMQTANRRAEPRTNPEAVKYPAIGSLVAKFHGANDPHAPAYAAFMRSRSHVAFGGYLGQRYDPFLANEAARLPIYDLVGNNTGTMSSGALLELPVGVDGPRLQDRRRLLEQFDRLRRHWEHSPAVEAFDAHSQRAVALLTNSRIRTALDLEQEPRVIRERYGSHLWCQQALLARRLIEAGVAFITLDLSYHTASGTWDTHGDNIPPYGGIRKGLGPLLPLFDHLVTTLVEDLDQRGLLDQTLVVAMGEFGRTPRIGTQGSTDGRDHWPFVMTVLLAGGGLRHGQVVGSSTADGGDIQERPITPGDLAATIYRHFGIPLDSTYTDPAGRLLHLLPDGGEPIRELF